MRLYRRATPDGNPRQLTSEAPGNPYGLAQAMRPARGRIGRYFTDAPDDDAANPYYARMMADADLQLSLNSDMRPTYDSIRPCDAVELWPDLAEIARCGWILSGERLYLAAPGQPAPPDTGDDWEAERWVNEVHLSTDTPSADPSWRAELLEQGLCLAISLLAEANKRLPVQAIIGLQSALGRAEPEIDFACGSVHFYVIREPRDDASQRIEAFVQPVLTLTAQAE